MDSSFKIEILTTSGSGGSAIFLMVRILKRILSLFIKFCNRLSNSDCVPDNQWITGRPKVFMDTSSITGIPDILNPDTEIQSTNTRFSRLSCGFAGLLQYVYNKSEIRTESGIAAWSV